MRKTVIYVILALVFLLITFNKTEKFTDTNTNTSINLVEYDMYQIKDAIDKVAYNEYINAINKIKKDHIKIIIDAFNTSLKEKSIQEQKKVFESNSFIQSIFTNEKLELSDNFKQSLFIELSEAQLLNRNIEMVPLRLYAIDKIVSRQSIKKISENLQKIQLKKINSFFISFLLKYYDITQPLHAKNEEILRFDKGTPSFEEINSMIKKSNLFFD